MHPLTCQCHIRTPQFVPRKNVAFLDPGRAVIDVVGAKHYATNMS